MNFVIDRVEPPSPCPEPATFVSAWLPGNVMSNRTHARTRNKSEKTQNKMKQDSEAGTNMLKSQLRCYRNAKNESEKWEQTKPTCFALLERPAFRQEKITNEK